jgi:non-heme chloroperoxidase
MFKFGMPTVVTIRLPEVLCEKSRGEKFMPHFNVADGTKLFYSVWGTGYPVLCVHGANIGSEIWDFQLPYLMERGYQCIVYDQRGFSRSDCPGSGYDFDTLASDLNGLIQHLKLDQCSVMTFSMGGSVLARYLTRYGAAKVEKAVLVAAITPFLLRTPDNPDSLDRATAYEPFRLGMQKDRPQLLRDSIDAFFSPTKAENPVSEGIKQWAIDLATRSSLMPMLELSRTSNETDFREDMKAFTMPTRIIHGDADVIAPLHSTGIPTHELIVGSRLTLYPGASHGVLITHHDRLNREIIEFIGSSDLKRDDVHGALLAQSD